jgi:hypothetical protein
MANVNTLKAGIVTWNTLFKDSSLLKCTLLDDVIVETDASLVTGVLAFALNAIAAVKHKIADV